MDKLPKIGSEAVIREMTETVGASVEQAQDILRLGNLAGDTHQKLDQLQDMLAGNALGTAGVAKLRELFQACDAAGISAERLELDVSIARGLDYYTGTIYETFLDDLPEIGSVCSGGRYDNLAELFTKQRLPGVGASLGLDRLLAAMRELNMVGTEQTSAQVLVTVFDPEHLGDYLRVARLLRSAQIPTEVYPEQKAIGKQLKYANRRGFAIALIAGSDEFAAGHWQVKFLRDRQSSQQTVSEDALVELIRSHNPAQPETGE